MTYEGKLGCDAYIYNRDVFTARCFAERGYATVYCLSVCLSVRLSVRNVQVQ